MQTSELIRFLTGIVAGMFISYFIAKNQEGYIGNKSNQILNVQMEYAFACGQKRALDSNIYIKVIDDTSVVFIKNPWLDTSHNYSKEIIIIK
jgi:hypothetical protein